MWDAAVESDLEGIDRVYVDDTLAASTSAFAERTKITERTFKSKP